MRLLNATPRSFKDLRLALLQLAIDCNARLGADEQVQIARDLRCLEPFVGATQQQVVDAGYITIGAYTETPERSRTFASRRRSYLMLERYFVWCRGLADEVARYANEPPPGHAMVVPGLDVTEYKRAGLLGHWFAALCPVIEGWEELKLGDFSIDELLRNGTEKGYRSKLLRFRHGVVHFQRSADDGRFAEFMDPVGEARAWALQLERAFEEFFQRVADSGYVELHSWLTR